MIRAMNMIIGEALNHRSDLQKRIAQLQDRLRACVVAQEGEEPPENPNELLAEIDRQCDELEGLIAKINHANAQARLTAGETVTEALARRDVIALRQGALRAAIKAATGDDGLLGERVLAVQPLGDPHGAPCARQRAAGSAGRPVQAAARAGQPCTGAQLAGDIDGVEIGEIKREERSKQSVAEQGRASRPAARPIGSHYPIDPRQERRGQAQRDRNPEHRQPSNAHLARGNGHRAQPDADLPVRVGMGTALGSGGCWRGFGNGR